MRGLYRVGMTGVLSVAWLTGCETVRGPEGHGSDCQVGVVAPRIARQPIQDYTSPASGTSSITAATPIGTEPRAIVTPVKAPPLQPAPIQPVQQQQAPLQALPIQPVQQQQAPLQPPPIPVPPLAPRLPPVNETPPAMNPPALPSPPSPKTVVELDALPADKIAIYSNLDPQSARPTVRDLKTVGDPEKTIVQAAPTPDAAPSSVKPAAATTRKEPIACGHDERFTCVTGLAEAYRKTIRVRYAAIDQEDRYGGLVTLEASGALRDVHDGQHIRVRGQLIPPTERNGRPLFRVTTVEILD